MSMGLDRGRSASRTQGDAALASRGAEEVSGAVSKTFSFLGLTERHTDGAYSCRSAITGSMRDARRAGIRDARAATARRIKATVTPAGT